MGLREIAEDRFPEEYLGWIITPEPLLGYVARNTVYGRKLAFGCASLRKLYAYLKWAMDGGTEKCPVALDEIVPIQTEIIRGGKHGRQ
jgi:hypothetical protein